LVSLFSYWQQKLLITHRCEEQMQTGLVMLTIAAVFVIAGIVFVLTPMGPMPY